MAFSPAPRTWADSDFVTGTMMDTEIRDNLNQLLIPTVTAYTATDYSTVATAATVTFTARAGRTYRISAGLSATQVSTGGIVSVKLLCDTALAVWIAGHAAATVTAGGAVPAIPAMYVMVGDGASHTFAVTIASTAGAVRVSAGVTMGCNQLVVERIA
jgi:hypothetical protein